MSKHSIPIGVRSMFGHRTQQPLVILRVGEGAPQLTPAQARQIGHWLLEAAEAADHDAALLAFCRQRDWDERFAAGILAQLRAARGTGAHDTEVEEGASDAP